MKTALSRWGLLVVAVAIFWPALAAAEPGQPTKSTTASPRQQASRTAVVEVVETGEQGRERRVVFTVALAEDDRASRIEVHEGGADYRVTLRRRSQSGTTAVVSLDLRRIQRQKKARTNSTELSMTSRVAVGKRAVMGRIERTNGGAIEVAVTLR
jgi:hypothetical protein